MRLLALVCLLSLASPFYAFRCRHVRSAAQLRMSTSSQQSLSNRIIRNIKLMFPSSGSRVLECFEKFTAGEEYDVLFGDKMDPHDRQRCNCYVKGLTTASFHDTSSNNFRWVKALEEESNYNVIYDELKAFVLENDEKWNGPRFIQPVATAHYGPEWKTLALQDRCVWNDEYVNAFSGTIQVLEKVCAPSCEVFFARQGPKSGIQPHSDLNNFILTCHLAIDVPKDKSWIRVGKDVRYWENGKTMVLDTSIYHSTRNEADSDRYVLLIRFWHPDLTTDEVKAFKFIFDFLDQAALGDNALDIFEMEQVLGGTTSEQRPISLQQESQQQPSLSRQQKRQLERKEKNTAPGSATSTMSNNSIKTKAPARGFHSGKH